MKNTLLVYLLLFIFFIVLILSPLLWLSNRLIELGDYCSYELNKLINE